MSSGESIPPRRVEFAQQTDVGMRRAMNQDALSCRLAVDGPQFKKRGHLFVVADGMGAHAAGELASKMASENVVRLFYEIEHVSAPAALRQAIRQTNQLIFEKGQSSAEFQGMGTTCTSLAILPEGALIAHVGDSRAYRLRSKWFEQLTFDHSLVWEMAAASPDGEAPGFIPKNIITRSLGPHENVNIDLEGPYSVEAGDIFLVCSDGLSGQLEDEEIGAILRVLSPTDAVQTLIDIANLRGGPDNITAIVAEVIDPPASESADDEDGGTSSDVARGATERSAHSEGEHGVRTATPTYLWGAVLVAIVLLVVMGWAGSPLGVILAAAGLGAALATIVFSKMKHPPVPASPWTSAIGGPYGNGPYSNSDSLPSRRICDQFAELSHRLHALADRHKWQIDWTPVDSICRRGELALQQGEFETSVCAYCEAFREVGSQIREQKTDTFDDSSNVVL